jgi:phage terminase small subunit
MEKAALRKAVETSLLNQLERKGTDTPALSNLVEDYMSFWDKKEELNNDLQARGTVITEYNFKGEPILKENPSLKSMIMVNKQMLAILKELRLTADRIISTEDDDVEL